MTPGVLAANAGPVDLPRTQDRIRMPADRPIVLDMKRDYGAVGDGKADDTAAFQRAIDENKQGAGKIIYIPAGTYLISDSLSLGGKQHADRGITFQGEGVDLVTIKLKDRCPGFGDPAKPRRVLAFFEGGHSGDSFGNGVYHLTIDVGAGNPGAVGLQFHANNQGSVQDVVIRSSDPAGTGAIGMDFLVGEPGPNLIQRVLIEGFDFGVKVSNHDFSVTFEHLTLRNQRVAGVHVLRNVVNIRKLHSVNTVPALVLADWDATVVLLDALLESEAADGPAVVSYGQLLLRDVKRQGYGTMLDNQGGNGELADVSDDVVEEYVTRAAAGLFDTPPRTLRLPVRETPIVPWTGPEDWVYVELPTDKPIGRKMDGDVSTAAIQAAFDRAAAEGKSTVVFPAYRPHPDGEGLQWITEGSYTINSTIRVHGSVRRVYGLESNLYFSGSLTEGEWLPAFKIEDLNDDVEAIVFEQFWMTPWRTDVHGRKWTVFENHTDKALVLKNLSPSGANYRSVVRDGRTISGPLFVTDVTGHPYYFGPGQQVWARQINPEDNDTMIVNDGGDLWIFGIKVEGYGTVVETKNGGRTEVLGGLLYHSWGPKANRGAPAFSSVDSDLSVSYATTVFTEDRRTDLQVRAQRGDRVDEVRAQGLPGRTMGLVVPLAVERRE